VSKTTPVVKLTDEEIAAIRALRDEKSARGAAVVLGVGRATVVAVVAGEPVHRLTAELVRRYIGSGTGGTI
jgi:putative heme degradation protein